MKSPSRLSQLIFLVSNIAVLGVAFLLNVALTHWMTTEDFGKYKYTTNFILVIPSLLGLGINFSVARLVARAKGDAEARPVIAAGIVAAFTWGLVISGVLALGTLLLSQLKWEVTRPLVDTMTEVRIIVPFVAIFMLQVTVNAAYQGMGRVLALALFNLFPYLLIMGGTAAWVYFYKRDVPFEVAAYLFLIGAAVVMIPRVLAVRGGGGKIRDGLRSLRADVREVGRHIYVSAIFTSSITMVLGLILGGFYGFEEYGHYSLAVSLAMMLSLVSSTMATAQFRKNAQRKSIARTDLLFTVGLSLFVLLVFMLTIDVIFFWFYPDTFARTVLYLKILAVAYVIFGTSEYLNRFLMAKGRGKEILRIAVISGVVNVTVSVALGWKFGLLGLAIATVGVAVINLSLYVVSYRAYLAGTNDPVSEPETETE